MSEGARTIVFFVTFAAAFGIGSVCPPVGIALAIVALFLSVYNYVSWRTKRPPW